MGNTMEKETVSGICPYCNNRYDLKWYKSKKKCSECGKQFEQMAANASDKRSSSPAPAITSTPVKQETRSKYVRVPVGGGRRQISQDLAEDVSAGENTKEVKKTPEMSNVLGGQKITAPASAPRPTSKPIPKPEATPTPTKKGSLFEEEDEELESPDTTEETSYIDEPDDLVSEQTEPDFMEDEPDEYEDAVDSQSRNSLFDEEGNDIEEYEDEKDNAEEDDEYEDEEPLKNPVTKRKKTSPVSERLPEENEKSKGEEKDSSLSPAQWLRSKYKANVIEKGEERLVDESVYDSNWDGYYDDQISLEMPQEDRIPKTTIFKFVGAIILMFGFVAFMIYYA